MALVQSPLPFKVKKSSQFYSKIKDEENPNAKNDKVLIYPQDGNCNSSLFSKRNSLKRAHGNDDFNDPYPRKISKHVSKMDNQSGHEQKTSKKKGLKIKKINDVLHNASVALHGNKISRLPGREKELEILQKFLLTHLTSKTSGSLYISGPPGTGKTASLMYLLDTPQFKDFIFIYVNCAALKSASAIYQKICKELKLKTPGKSEKACLQCLEDYLDNNRNMILLVLDEIDQLDSKKQSILYTIFDWPARESSKLVIVGIANALDLTDRMLPRLQKKLQLRPMLLHFPPYSKEQIVQILTARLSDRASNVFSPVALQLLGAKVAALSGDVRRALDLARLVIEVKTKSDASSNIDNMTNGDKNMVEVKEVLRVLENVYGNSHKLENDIVEAFPLQQKLLICSLLLMVTKGKTKDVTVGQLYQVYSRVGKKRNITVVDNVEFAGLCELVQTRGIIKLSGKKERRMNKVCLQWDEREVHNALKDKKLIADILSDMSCLSH